MKDMIKEKLQQKAAELTEFARELIRTQSYTCHEGDVAKLVQDRMRELGYESIDVDAYGNVIGRIGGGPRTLMFDSHMDTVGVIDADEWKHDPFGAEMDGGCIYGRGACDMKAGLASSIYAGAIARELGLPDEISVIVSASVMEEDYDGEAVRYLLSQEKKLPDAIVMCEPTNLDIACRHNGRSLVRINMPGIPAHGSSPQLGDNPVYKLREIIDRVQERADELQDMPAPHGTLALTNIYCHTTSNNSVPADASIILDRRMTFEETEEGICSEMDQLLAGTDAKWEFVDLEGMTWTGTDFRFHSFLPALNTETDTPIVQNALKAGESVLGRKPALIYLGGTTNAVASSGIYGVPTIICGPGDMLLAHAKDEMCPVQEIIDAAAIYAEMCMIF